MSESGKILALREQTELYLDESRAEEIDERLSRARMLESGHSTINFSSIHARPVASHDVIRIRTSDASIVEAWGGGQLTTGDDALDELLESLQPSQFEYVRLEFLDTEYLELRFARWVKMETLVEQLNEFSYLDAELIGTEGDGPDIDLIDETDVSQFTFYFKWGDCLSGCIYSHYWEVVVPHDAEQPPRIATEGGDPLP